MTSSSRAQHAYSNYTNEEQIGMDHVLYQVRSFCQSAASWSARCDLPLEREIASIYRQAREIFGSDAPEALVADTVRQQYALVEENRTAS